MLGDQAVNLVGQDLGLTVRNQPHREVTAIVQAPDRTRGDVQTPRDPGLRNPQASSLELQEPPGELSSSASLRDLWVGRSQNEIVQPHSMRGHGSTSEVGVSEMVIKGQ